MSFSNFKDKAKKFIRENDLSPTSEYPRRESSSKPGPPVPPRKDVPIVSEKRPSSMGNEQSSMDRSSTTNGPSAYAQRPGYSQARSSRRDDYTSSHQSRKDDYVSNRQAIRPEEYIAQLQDKVRRLEDAVRQQEGVITDLERHVSDQKEQYLTDVKEREAELRELQSTAFKDIQPTRWEPFEDSQINQRLSDFQADIQQIAKTYSIDHVAAYKLSNDQLQALDGELNEAGVADVTGKAVMLSMLEPQFGPRICVTALLSAAVHRLVLTNPFFFMADGMDGDFDSLPENFRHLEQRPDPADALEQYLHRIAKVDARSANVWRSDTLRLLMPEEHDTSPPAEELRQEMRIGCRDQCLRAARSFEEGPVAALLNIKSMETATKDGFRKTLTQLFEDAGRMAMRLWTQRTAIKCSSLPDLRKEPFAVDSTLMQAHNLHKLDDPKDHRLDGKRIKLVVHPAVLRYGTHDGEDYERSQVWAKAIVWLDA
ncbi:hypothetical protein LTR86_005190 [Recurvomyces mirabilis]|nr:hypothetical protein LTR86_005190 [Recurvomyces mirabilis]